MKESFFVQQHPGNQHIHKKWFLLQGLSKTFNYLYLPKPVMLWTQHLRKNIFHCYRDMWRERIDGDVLDLCYAYPMQGLFPVCNYIFKINNKNTGTRCEISSKLTIKTPEGCQWRFGVFIINFEQTLHLVLVFLLLTLSTLMTTWFPAPAIGRDSHNHKHWESCNSRLSRVTNLTSLLLLQCQAQ